MYIAVRGILAAGVCSTVHEQGEHGIETSCHLHRVLEFVAACIVDVQNLPVNIIAAWGVPYKRILRGEVRGLQDHGGVASGKTDPGILPGVLLIRAVDNLGVRVDQKSISAGQMVSLTGDAVGAFSGDDIDRGYRVPTGRGHRISGSRRCRRRGKPVLFRSLYRNFCNDVA